MSDDGDEKYGGKVERLINNYIAFFDRCNWPDPDGDEWKPFVKGWISAFGEHRYSPNRIEAAMNKARRDPPQWMQDHLPALLKLLAEDGSTGPTDPLPAFEDCDKCGGNGWTTIYRADYCGDEAITVHDPINNKSRRVFLRITCPCVCKLGRRAYASAAAKNVKTVDAMELPRGWSFDEPDWVPSNRKAMK